MRRILAFMVLASTMGCSKSSSTGDGSKQDHFQTVTQDEARPVIKALFIQYVGGKQEVELVSISEPIQPSSKYLESSPGASRILRQT
jgi:hypothetical protein